MNILSDKNQNKDRFLLDALLYLFCFLPFLYLLPISSDTQPYALIMAVCYLLFRRKVYIPSSIIVSISIYIAIFLTALITCLFVSSTAIYGVLRKVYTYVSCLIIPVAVYNSLKRTNGLIEKWVKAGILVWFFVAFIQATIYPDFMGGLVSNFRTTPTRGVPGLASEPSYYGYVLIFLGVLSLQFKHSRDRILYSSLCVLQIVLLAESSVAIVYLLVFFVAFLVKGFISAYKYNPQKVLRITIILLALAVVGYHLGKSYAIKHAESRMVSLLSELVFEFKDVRTLDDIYRLDESVGARVNAVYVGIKGMIDNSFLPQGFIYSSNYTYFNGRIMSGYGVVLYEFGFIGIALLTIYTIVFLKGFNNSLPLTIGITAMMFSCVQLASPIFSFVLGAAMFYAEEKRIRRIDSYGLKK